MKYCKYLHLCMLLHLCDDIFVYSFRVPCSAFCVPRSVFRVPCSVFCVPRSVFRVPCSEFPVLRSELGVFVG